MYKKSLILAKIEGLIINGLIAEAKGEYDIFDSTSNSGDCNPIFHLLYSTDCLKEKTKILTTYISWKVSVDCVDYQGRNIWHHIVMLKNFKNYSNYIEKQDKPEEYIKSLNDFGRIIARSNRLLHTQPDNSGITPMLMAFQHKDLDSMKVLFGLGDDPNSVLPNVNISMFKQAIEEENWEVIELLLSKPSLKLNINEIKDLYCINNSSMQNILDKKIRLHAKKRIEKELNGELSLGIISKTGNSNQSINTSNENLIETKLSPRDTTSVQSIAESKLYHKGKDSNNLIKKPLPPLPQKATIKSLPELPLKDQNSVIEEVKPISPSAKSNSESSVSKPVVAKKSEAVVSSAVKPVANFTENNAVTTDVKLQLTSQVQKLKIKQYESFRENISTPVAGKFHTSKQIGISTNSFSSGIVSKLIDKFEVKSQCDTKDTSYVAKVSRKTFVEPRSIS